MSLDTATAIYELYAVLVERIERARRVQLARRISRVKAAALFGPEGKRERGLVVAHFAGTVR